MTRLSVVIALWAAFAFVTWNVLFDRYVMTAAVEFTREQVVRHQRREALTSIHDGFTPRVHDAAQQASLRVAPLVLVGAASIFVSFRRVR